MSKKKEKAESLGQSVGVGASEPQKDYETESNLRTIMDAHSIMDDEGKMKKVRALAGKQNKFLSGIAKVKATSTDDLRAIRNKKYGPNAKEDGDDE